MAKFKQKYPETFGAEYWVYIDYQKEDGFWECNKLVEVLVRCAWGETGKDLHDEAAKIVKKQFPGCEIKSVTYC